MKEKEKMTETKVIQVPNDAIAINKSNEVMGKFGWNVLSVQVTHSQNTKTYTKGLDYWTGNKTVETTTLNYATITYQRDRGIKNYSQIAEIERAYDELSAQIVAEAQIEKPKAYEMKDWIIAGVLSIMLFPIGLIIAVVYMTRKPKSETFSKKNAAYEQECVLRNKKIEALRIKQQELLCNAEMFL